MTLNTVFGITIIPYSIGVSFAAGVTVLNINPYSIWYPCSLYMEHYPLTLTPTPVPLRSSWYTVILQYIDCNLIQTKHENFNTVIQL